MAAVNTQPIYSGTPDIQWITSMTAANNTADLTGVGVSYLVFTADATNGGFLREIRLKANPANNTAATVLRAWVNNGSTVGTASNSALISEIGVPATTAAANSPTPDLIMSINQALPAGYKVYLTIATAPGGSGAFTATAFGGKY